MARKLRIEYPGAFYHVINRGNYRSWIFETEGARHAFLLCLKECCEAKGWRLHAWCLMSNHYHLLVETPRGNLVDGMRWLQSTFANRFNRFRGENGHVFQGRYKALILSDEAIGPVCHYIHLNPFRAGLVEAGELQSYSSSSFHQLWYPSKRWPFVNYETGLEYAGGLADNAAGRRRYRQYLAAVAGDEAQQERLGFARMCWGWAKGDAAFKKRVLSLKEDGKEGREHVESETAEIGSYRWEESLYKLMDMLGKSMEELKVARKGADWKVALAIHLRKQYQVPHRWLAHNLSMGKPSSVQSWVSNKREDAGVKIWLQKLQNHGILD
mgnify:CR=1 FL=1